MPLYPPTDAPATTGSLRTLGTGALQATAGNDARLSDSRAPSGSASGDLAGSYPSPTVAKASKSFGLTGIISPTQLTANTDNWNPTGLADAAVIKIDVSTAINLTGIDATTAYDGRELVLINTTTNIITLSNDATSTAANRFKCPQTRDRVIGSNGIVLLIYDATLSRWRVFPYPHGSQSTPSAIGTAAAGSSGQQSSVDHVHPTGAGTPSTQAFADAAAVGAGPGAAMDNHKHAMPTLGYGLAGNSAPAVGLTTAESYATAETTLSAATYADIAGPSITLAAGTWLLLAQVTGRVVNAHALMLCAITDSANTVITEGASAIPASGTASVNSLGTCSLSAIVTPGGSTTYKLRGARGTTTLTTSWIAMDGNGLNTANQASNNSDKATSLRAVRLA